MFDEPSFAIKERFYTSFFKPHLKDEPVSEQYYYFLDQSWEGWRLNVSKNDIKNMLFVEWVCEQLYKDDPNNFAELVSYLLSQSHDAIERIAQSEETYFQAKTEEKADIVKKFASALRHYKVFFESELRLWSTVPYYFCIKKFGIKSGGSTPDTYVEIPASTKFQVIKNIKTILPQGDLKSLVLGFDNTIRNAGEGHDRYEITDNDTAILHDIDPITGKHKGTKPIEISYGQLTNLIDTCRKSIWVLRNGLIVFAQNNPNFRKIIGNIKPLKLREIEQRFREFADTRWFEVKEFNYNKELRKLKLSLKYFEKHVGVSSALYFGNGERYDLLDIESKVKYKHQVWGVIQFLLSNWNEKTLPEIDLKIFDNKGHCLSSLTYSNIELKKLLEGKNKYEPIPSKGTITEEEYIMVTAIRVPYGSREFTERLVEQRGHKVRKLPR